ncbi:MAG TPA: MtrB/PioB family outer membrane beta-barrel protein [Casimicrobiaceae bacterium]|nr:MtrB/PioB family outer membrane beta-barrel protein [Casimicrobiaceae bacterium]
MRKTLLSTLIASLFVATPAFAQSDEDPMRVEGGGTLGGFYNHQNAQDAAKLQEYQDLGNGVLSNVFARGRNSTNWFEGYGENFGRSDQYMFIRGGVYGVFKAGAYLNDMPHDFQTNSITPYTGVGSGLLKATFPALDTTQWNTFNLGYERRDAGGYFEWQRESPWYLRVDGNQVKFDGTKVGSGALGTSPGNGYIALPIPVQYSTTNAGVEGGYQTSKATYALRWDYSHFDNAITTLNWSNPFFGSLLDSTQLPADNTFNKFTGTANWRDLPWNSVIAARYTWSKTTDNVGIPMSQLNSFPTVAASNLTLPDTTTFNGENVNQSFALGWTAHPINTVDTRVFYYWTKLQNNSSDIVFGNTPTVPLPSGLSCDNVAPPAGSPPGTAWPNGNCEPDQFNYTKNDVGFDVYWRFARGQRLGFGYDYWNLNQTRVDYDKAHANTVFVEYKNTMLDTLSGRIKYRYIKRDSTHNYSDVGVSPNDPNYLLPFTSAFDMQDLTTNEVRLYLDWTPMPLFTTSFEGNWARNNYNDNTYGLQNNDTQGYYLSASWGAPDKIMIRGFGDWQQVKYPSNSRYIGTVSNGPPPAGTTPPGWCPLTGTSANPNCYDPNQQAWFIPTGSTSYTGSYNWSQQTKDQTWMIGVGADWPIAAQWLLNLSYIYVNNNGSATFSAPCCDKNGYSFNNPLNIGNYDDTRQQYFNVKASYQYTKNWSFAAGYAYEKYSRNDIGSQGFTYLTPSPTISTPTTSLSYLNGYNLNPNGNQNIFWMTVSYKFDAPPLPPAPAPKMVEAPKPVVAAPPPPPPPPPKAPQVTKITLDSKVLFAFDKAELTPEGKVAIDSQVISKLNQIQKLEVVLVAGYTDRLGSLEHNMKLSTDRADAVRDYIVSKGVPRNKIEAIGMGPKDPVVQCDQKNMKELIACLQPNRRVEVQAKGESAM